MIFQIQFLSLLRLLEANITEPFMNFLDSVKWLNLHFEVEVSFFQCNDEVIRVLKCLHKMMMLRFVPVFSAPSRARSLINFWIVLFSFCHSCGRITFGFMRPQQRCREAIFHYVSNAVCIAHVRIISGCGKREAHVP